MLHKDKVMVMTVYHPKPGAEDKFVKLWNETVCKLAYKMGADMMGIYHNEETDEFVASGYWPNQAFAQKFLDSEDLSLIARKLNHLCLIPAHRAFFEIFHEAA